MRVFKWQKSLYSTDFRLTNPRKIIINILSDTDKHFSAEDIYIKALKVNPTIGLTTVYRTLELFNRSGIVRKFNFGDGKARYELTNNPKKKKHHHHLICSKCKTIIDYADFMNDELDLMNKTEKALSEKHNFKIMSHTIHFYGLCEKCQKET
jgi:Fur family ferric uptake transcriptional regulator